MIKDYFKLICEYVENHPGWLWDFVTDPYAVHEFVAEADKRVLWILEDEIDWAETVMEDHEVLFEKEN